MFSLPTDNDWLLVFFNGETCEHLTANISTCHYRHVNIEQIEHERIGIHLNSFKILS